MKQRIFGSILAFLALSGVVLAQELDARQIGILEERVSRLNAQVEDLQFRQQQMQKDLDGIRGQLQELRRAAGSVDSSELKALEDRIAAVDAARQADKRAIVDQLAKELAGLGKTAAPVSSSTGKEHVVQKGETLTIIAKANGVTVADLKKANNLTGDDIKIGQKLVIPR